MKTTHFFPLLFLMVFVLSSKAFADEPRTAPNDSIHIVVDTMPEFPGGMQALQRFLRDNIPYPTIGHSSIQGRVVVQFVVRKTGEITDIAVVRGVDPLLDREAIRVVQLMPRWIPGEHQGEKVNVLFTFPVRFGLW